MAVTLGSNGVLEANLIIPQSTTFACAIEHTDTEGTPIDHTGYTPYMRIIDKQKKLAATLRKLADGIRVKSAKSITDSKRDLDNDNKSFSMDGLRNDASNDPLQLV